MSWTKLQLDTKYITHQESLIRTKLFLSFTGRYHILWRRISLSQKHPKKHSFMCALPLLCQQCGCQKWRRTWWVGKDSTQIFSFPERKMSCEERWDIDPEIYSAHIVTIRTVLYVLAKGNANVSILFLDLSMVLHWSCGRWWQNCTAVCLFVLTNGRSEWWGGWHIIDTCGVWRTAPHWDNLRDPPREIPNPPGAKNSSLQNTHQDVIKVFRPNLTELTNPYHLWKFKFQKF